MAVSVSIDIYIVIGLDHCMAADTRMLGTFTPRKKNQPAEVF